MITIKRLCFALWALTAFTGCSEDDDKDKTYQVGDFAQGGIVFWVDETRQHGLVCAKANQHSSIWWGSDEETGATGDGIGDGAANTEAIVNTYRTSISYAALICYNLEITENGKTYNDWYLPSKEELNQMYENMEIINTTAATNEGYSLGGWYWSSSEFNSSSAWNQPFTLYDNNGEQGYAGKNNTGIVRAVRAF